MIQDNEERIGEAIFFQWAFGYIFQDFKEEVKFVDVYFGVISIKMIFKVKELDQFIKGSMKMEKKLNCQLEVREMRRN